jgi:hypothetical protein
MQQSFLGVLSDPPFRMLAESVIGGWEKKLATSPEILR